jgi:hypothetical protein
VGPDTSSVRLPSALTAAAAAATTHAVQRAPSCARVLSAQSDHLRQFADRKLADWHLPVLMIEYFVDDKAIPLTHFPMPPVGLAPSARRVLAENASRLTDADVRAAKVLHVKGEARFRAKDWDGAIYFHTQAILAAPLAACSAMFHLHRARAWWARYDCKRHPGRADEEVAFMDAVFGALIAKSTGQLDVEADAWAVAAQAVAPGVEQRASAAQMELLQLYTHNLVTTSGRLPEAEVRLRALATTGGLGVCVCVCVYVCVCVCV